MAIQLVERTEKYIADTENEAMELIETTKSSQNANGYTVKNSGYKLKQKRSKGEVIEEHFITTLTVSFE